MIARAAAVLAALALIGCAGVPEPPDLDLDAHAHLTVEGFREVSPVVAARLDRAAAWAVFPDVEDVADGCVHEGRLYTAEGAIRPVTLRCTASPLAPAGVAYHALVILSEGEQLAALDGLPLDLDGAPHVTLADGPQPSLPRAPVLVITSPRGGLLFEPRRPHHRIELVGAD